MPHAKAFSNHNLDNIINIICRARYAPEPFTYVGKKSLVDDQHPPSMRKNTHNIIAEIQARDLQTCRLIHLISHVFMNLKGSDDEASRFVAVALLVTPLQQSRWGGR